MESLITILLGAIGSLLATEILANAPRLGRWFIEQAVLRLPASKRDHYHEEWLSHLEGCSGAIGKLRHALGCYFRAARELAAEEKHTPATEQAVIKFMIKIVVRILFLPYALYFIVRGNFNNLKAFWSVTEFMMFGAYMLRNKFGATNTEVKAVMERCTRTLRAHAEKPPIEAAQAALKEFDDAVLEIRKRQRPHLRRIAAFW